MQCSKAWTLLLLKKKLINILTKRKSKHKTKKKP